MQTKEFSELTRLGIEFYEKHLKSKLEPEHNGEFVAIEPYAGEYFLNKNKLQAILEARAAMPDKQFFLAKVGTIYTASISHYVPEKYGHEKNV
jgi:hypothetical protein